MPKPFLMLLLAEVFLCSSMLLSAQRNTSSAVSHMETAQELVARLSPEQKQEFESAAKSFDGRDYSGALDRFKVLLHDLPGEPVLSKFASEAALQMGDNGYALAQLKPLAAANPDDWQAAALLTRAYAQAGDKMEREAGMAHMLELYRRGVMPKTEDYAAETMKVGENSLMIRVSLVPWGRYKVYEQGRVSDREGKVFLRITLESSDFDQPGCAQQHPREVEAGARCFSLDAYRETALNASGQRTQTHFTFAFFVGQPSYDDVRAQFLKIAEGKASPLSSRSGLMVP